METGQMQKILLPVDTSDSARRAIEYVLASKSEQAREIHLLNVQPAIVVPHVIVYPKAEMIMRARRAAGEEILRPVRALLDVRGISYTAQVLFGRVAGTIVRYAKESGCDSIVI